MLAACAGPRSKAISFSNFLILLQFHPQLVESMDVNLLYRSGGSVSCYSCEISKSSREPVLVFRKSDGGKEKGRRRRKAQERKDSKNKEGGRNDNMS